MTPDPLWRTIHDSLRGDIAAGRYRPGDKLPTEAALAARFCVNRHTVRRALGERRLQLADLRAQRVILLGEPRTLRVVVVAVAGVPGGRAERRGGGGGVHARHWRIAQLAPLLVRQDAVTVQEY